MMIVMQTCPQQVCVCIYIYNTKSCLPGHHYNGFMATGAFSLLTCKNNQQNTKDL